MLLSSNQIRLSATDLANHLACHHVTTLDLAVARHERSEPQLRSPDLLVIQELGLRHETAYFESLRASAIEFVDLRDIKSESQALAETRSAMEKGIDAIAQGSLASPGWFGHPDLLRKVAKPSALGNWSYEAYDCKLSRDTKATTILQLALYSELLAEIQGVQPEAMHVVLPGEPFQHEFYRFAEYAAYYRYVRKRLQNACENGTTQVTYPEPCAHCDICRWFRECDTRRRADDHLSLVAGITHLQRNQLVAWETDTMAKLAALPVPLKQKPLHGSRDSYERVQKQARIQVAGRNANRPLHETLPVQAETGFCKLPAPSPRDIFVDLEGDPFAGITGLQYLFGFAHATNAGELAYEKHWAFTPAEEKAAFEWLVDEIMRRWQQDPSMHVYHFGAYEPSAFKRLMGIYTTREDEIDRMLRAHLFVDLHTILKQAVRASVEEYSLKAIEKFYEFPRSIPPDDSRAAMRFVEHSLELGRAIEIPEKYRDALESYNGDDCRSTAKLREWLEAERQKLVNAGTQIPRPPLEQGDPPEELNERQKRVAALVAQLTSGIPTNPSDRTKEQQARWLVAQLLDWHRRDAKPKAWRYFELRDMDDEQLMDERDAVSGLTWLSTMTVEEARVDRYSFPNQETDVRPNAKKEAHHKGQRVGTIVGIDLAARTIDIKKTAGCEELHPTSIFIKEPYRKAEAQQDSLLRFGCWIRDGRKDPIGCWSGVWNFLLRDSPNLKPSSTLAIRDTEEFGDELARIISVLDFSVLPVQGPPGSGKTTSAARAIHRLVSERDLQIGVTALSHSVIRNLLQTITNKESESIRCIHKSDGTEKEDCNERLAVTTNNRVALRHLQQRSMDVLGGTSFLWSRGEFANSVDVLIVDEASQVSLADLVAISQAAKNVVLIGDPQQLSRPSGASHPPGAELSSLEHALSDIETGILKTLKTMPATLGLFIDETKRLHPKICCFTSELFYENRLTSRDFTRSRILEGHSQFKDAGLWFVPVEHQGNRNSAPEEVDAIAQIIHSLLAPDVYWFRGIGNKKKVALDDVLIVAPYNAQVSDLLVRLPDAKVGTVDKFQGQEAAIVIYSLTTSSPQDAPRGMEFLYSLNRLNVATSRAMSIVIVVGGPKLPEPECKTPRQMQLANALCRYLELATTITPSAISTKPGRAHKTESEPAAPPQGVLPFVEL